MKILFLNVLEIFDRLFIEEKTRGSHASKPDVPKFIWHRFSSDNNYAAIKVTWLPHIDGKPGSHFFVKYR